LRGVIVARPPRLGRRRRRGLRGRRGLPTLWRGVFAGAVATTRAPASGVTFGAAAGLRTSCAACSPSRPPGLRVPVGLAAPRPRSFELSLLGSRSSRSRPACSRALKNSLMAVNHALAGARHLEKWARRLTHPQLRMHREDRRPPPPCWPPIVRRPTAQPSAVARLRRPRRPLPGTRGLVDDRPSIRRLRRRTRDRHWIADHVDDARDGAYSAMPLTGPGLRNNPEVASAPRCAGGCGM